MHATFDAVHHFHAEDPLRYRVIVPVSLLALAVALGLGGLGLVWVTIAAFLVLVGTPEITAVIVDNVFNEAVPSRHRASLLSMIAFVESALIGIGYLVVGALMDELGLECGYGHLRRGPHAGMSPMAPGALPRGTGDHRDREARRPKGRRDEHPAGPPGRGH